MVQVVYAIPADKAFNEEYNEAILDASQQMRTWYGHELGRTFALAETVLRCDMPFTEEVVLQDRDRDKGTVFRAVVRGMHDCTDPPGQITFGQKTVWVVYADVLEPCSSSYGLGQGGMGIAIMGARDLLGLTIPRYDDCGVGVFRPERWVGGMGHELGHGFGLPHPPGCDEGDEERCGNHTQTYWSLMWLGYASWPNTFLLQAEKNSLLAGPFMIDEGPPPVPSWTPSMLYTTHQVAADMERIVGFEATWIPEKNPPESLHEKDLAHYYAFQFNYGNDSKAGAGYFGLLTDADYRDTEVGQALNFSIWNSVAYDSVREGAFAETDNRESGGARIMAPVEWEEGDSLTVRMEASEHPDGYAYRLTLNGDLIGRIIHTQSPQEFYYDTVFFGEDLHWWRTINHDEIHECKDFERSVMQLVNVRTLHDREGAEVRDMVLLDKFVSWERQPPEVSASGHLLRYCWGPTVEEIEGGVRLLLGYPPDGN
ncbi:hypothetical protein [Candidatus Palauibacter sp.]|uniref:hypothetical protein n=1 Tax=Candidatus Palauibacter sp. TaxID=3101350 RepID=UPI003B0209FF